MNFSRTALIIFTKDAQTEAHSKNLFQANRKKNLLVINALNKRVHQTAKATGLTCFTIDSKKQVGDTFVSRYYNALKSVFDKGYDNVVIVGNDSPELNAHDLLKVAKQIEAGHNVVYGPTHQGGIYTLGLSLKGFNQLDFEVLPWQSVELLQEFDFLNNTNPDMLRLDKTLTEFNVEADLLAFLTYPKNLIKVKGFYNFLFNLCFDSRIPIFASITQANEFFSTSYSLRGPPVANHFIS